MTCPNWQRLYDLREQQPAVWDRALDHFDECPQCHEEALTVEPTLLFRHLPAGPPQAPEVGSEDIAAMRQAVATLRRNERSVRPAPPRFASSHSSFLRAAALAAVLLTAAFLQGVVPGSDEPPPQTPALAAAAEGSHPFDRMPLVEDLDPAYGSVVQVVDEGLSLVLVLPPSDV